MRRALLTTLLMLALLLVGCGDDDNPAGPYQGRTIRVPSRYPTIQEAVNTALPGDVVLVAAGTYADSIQTELWPDGPQVTVTLDLKDGVEVRGATGNPADVVLNGQAGRWVVLCTDTEESPKLSQLTITGGRTGIMGRHTDLIIENCVISGNDNDLGAGAGGGLYFDFSSPVLTNCMVAENQAPVGGGAVFANDSFPVLTNCFFQSNRALTTRSTHGQGGALKLSNDTVARITNCLFVSNHADSLGGAIAFYNAGIEMENCNLDENDTDGLGGAFYVNYQGDLVLNECTVVNNRAGREGGGFYFQPYSALTARGSTITHNFAPLGPDGFLDGPYDQAVVTLRCGVANPDHWEGSITVDNENCDKND